MELKFRVTLCHVLEFLDAWLLSDLSQVVYKTSIDHSVIVLHKNNTHYLKSLFWRQESEFSRLPPRFLSQLSSLPSFSGKWRESCFVTQCNYIVRAQV